VAALPVLPRHCRGPRLLVPQSLSPPPPRPLLLPYTTLFRSFGATLVESGPASDAGNQRTVPTPVPTSERRESARRSRLSAVGTRSEEHTSELQSRVGLVCRLLLEKETRERGRNRQHRSGPSI